MEIVKKIKEKARGEEPSQVVVYKKDGNFGYESTYGDDPVCIKADFSTKYCREISHEQMFVPEPSTARLGLKQQINRLITLLKNWNHQ